MNILAMNIILSNTNVRIHHSDTYQLNQKTSQENLKAKRLYKIYNTNKNCIINHNQSRRAILNVGGVRHEILWQHLKRLPNTRLGRLNNAKTIDEILKLCDNYNEKTNEYFFYRHALSFNIILNLYRTGKLHLIENVSSDNFKEELLYWGIGEFYLDVCCQRKYYEGKDDIIDEIYEEENHLLKVKKAMEFEKCCPNTREKTWNLLENPKSSLMARVRIFLIYSTLILKNSNIIRVVHNLLFILSLNLA